MNSKYSSCLTFSLYLRSGRVIRAMTASLGFGMVMMGCGGPTELTRDNRRLMDAVLTAVTIRSRDELSKDKTWLETKHDDGELSETTFTAIIQLIEKAEAGDWVTAERELYLFRRRNPFPQ